MDNESFAEDHLPPIDASISLLLQNDKDLLMSGSFRPRSLLNVDPKILLKRLGNAHNGSKQDNNSSNRLYA